MPALPVPAVTIGLLLLSNVVMTFARYGYLRFEAAPFAPVIPVPWGIAVLDHVLQVPADRIGHGTFPAAELKTIQEVLTLLVVAAFPVLYLLEPLGRNHALLRLHRRRGAALVFRPWA